MYSHAPKAEQRAPARSSVKESQGVQRSTAVGSRTASSFRPGADAPSIGAQAPVQRSVVQMIPVGYVPMAGYGAPYAALNDPAGNRQGDQPFSQAQKTTIYQDNIANRGARPARPANHGPVSDFSGNQLLERVEASQLTPEIDHIVPRVEQGANDVGNGRVLSKAENNAGFGIPRPGPNQKRLAVYETIDVQNGPYGGDWSADDGDKLNLNQVGDLLRYANNGVRPGSLAAAANVAVAQAIQGRGSGATRNGVRVT